MKTLTLLLLLLLLSSIGCNVESKPPATLSLGMTEADAVAQLKAVGAKDVSDGMQTAIPYTGEDETADTQTAIGAGWQMWSIESPDASIETTFEDG